MRSRDYGVDVLARGWRDRPPPLDVDAEPGVVIEEEATGFAGAVVGCDKDTVTLEDRHGKRRVFPLVPAGFVFEGRSATLRRPRSSAPAAARRTASGSVAVSRAPARVAQASRLYVEGRHDAE